MALFIKHPAQEVVLLTENGMNDAKIQGIVTQWDTASYAPGM